MKRMKKCLCLLMAAAMLLGVLPAFSPVEVFATGNEVLLDEGFETDPAARGWTFVDADGDGYNWARWNENVKVHSGDACLCSESYVNYVGALTPDNWAISPAVSVTADTALSFWVEGQDSNWCEEHYAVYAGETADPAAMTALSGELVSTDKWECKTFSLSAFAGKTVYIAFRHYNVTEMFQLNIDDVRVVDYAVASGTDGSVSWGVDLAAGSLMLLGTGPMTDHAADEPAWRVFKDMVTSVSIGSGITTIGAGAFTGFSLLTGVSIPVSVTAIGDSAFYGCSALKSVTIPVGVTAIGDEAFNGCTSLATVNYGGDEAAFNAIAMGARNDMLQMAYAGITGGICGAEGSYLTWLLADDGTLTVSGTGDMADYNDGNGPWAANRQDITALVIEPGVTSVGFGAFYYCDAMVSVTIPVSVTSIGAYAFADCDSLAEVNYAGTQAQWNAIAFGSDNAPLLAVRPVTGGVCGDNLTWELENGTLTISGTGAMADFDDYSGPWYIFRGLITTAVVSPGVTSIGDNTFESCENLTSVTIPDSVTSIGYGAFYNCTALTEVNYTGTQAQWNAIAFDTYNDPLLAVRPVTVGVCGDGLTWTLENGTLTISGTGAMTDFANSGAPWYSLRGLITTAVVSPGVTHIGNYAFYNCTALTEVNYAGTQAQWNAITFGSGNVPLLAVRPVTGGVCGDGLTWTLENGALTISGTGAMADFDDYSGPWYNSRSLITTAVVSPGVTRIGENAFESCGNLTSVTIPDSVTSIGNYGFYECNALTDVYYSGTEEEWNKIAVGSSNSILTNGSVTMHYPIGGGTCGAQGDNLTWTLYEDGLLTISGTGAMADNNDIVDSFVSEYSDSITSVVIDPGVTYVGGYAFYFLENLTSVTLPDTLTGIGDSAFRYCSALNQINIPAGVTRVGETALEGTGFFNSQPDGVVYLGKFALGYNGSMPASTAIEIAEGTEYIADYAFAYQYHLRSVTLPATLKSIPEGAFDECEALESVTFGKGVTAVGEDAFYYCNALTDVYYGGTAVQAAVIAIGEGNEPLTDAVWHYVPTELAAPTGVSAKPTAEKQLTLTWNAVADATQYNIYRWNGTAYKYYGTTFATDANPTQFVNTGLTVGTTYYYKVVAVYKDAYSTVVSDMSVSFSAMALGKPAVPAGVAVKPTAEKELTVSWSAVKGATQYNVYRYRGSDGQYHYLGTAFATDEKPTEYKDTGLTVGTDYYYKVVAAAKGNGLTFVGDMSASVKATALGKPGVPANVAVKPTAEKELTVSWSIVKGATQYNVYRYNGATYKYIGTTFATDEKPTEYKDTGLTVGVEYYYKVVAAAKGNGLTFVGDMSASAKAMALGKPGVPANVTVKPTAEKELTVSWTVVKGATQYNVYRYNGTAYKYIGTTFATDEKPTEFKNTGLTVGTDYYYKVVAAAKGNGLTFTSDMSAFAHTVALGKPAVPANVTVKPTAEKELTVSWSAVKGATQYNVYRYNGTAYKYIGTTFATDDKPTEYKDAGLTVGTDYYYKVMAAAKGNGLTFTSDMSAFAHTMALGSLPAPTGVKAAASGSKKITVSWSAVKGATQYNVYRYRGSDGQYHYVGTVLATDDKPTQYTDAGLTAGVTYYYKVVAAGKGNGLTFVSGMSASVSAAATN